MVYSGKAFNLFFNLGGHLIKAFANLRQLVLSFRRNLYIIVAFGIAKTAAPLIL